MQRLLIEIKNNLHKKNAKLSPLRIFNASKNIKKIQEKCNQKYSNRGFYGNASLNRKILLDPEIAEWLTPDTIHAIFILQSQNKTHKISVRRDEDHSTLIDILFYGFEDGLEAIQLMPNNDGNFGVKEYQTQKLNFEKNTKKIVNSIVTLCQSLGMSVPNITMPTEYNNLATQSTLSADFNKINETIELIKRDNQGNKLLSVPSYTPQNIRDQSRFGFISLCQKHNLKIETVSDGLIIKNISSLDELAQTLLSSDTILLNGTIIHLFYDRAHLEACLEQELVFFIEKQKYTLNQLLAKMVELTEKTGTEIAKEQFRIRLYLVMQDLKRRFSDLFSPKSAQPPAQSQPNLVKNPLDIRYLKKGPKKKELATLHLEEIVHALLNNECVFAKNNVFDEVELKINGKIYNLTKILDNHADFQQIELSEEFLNKYQTFMKTQSLFGSTFYQKFQEKRPDYIKMDYLHPSEKIAITNYTSQFYLKIQNFLRRHREDDLFSIKEILLTTAVATHGLTKPLGTNPLAHVDTTYRKEIASVNAPFLKERMKDITKGIVSQTNAFSSSSIDKEAFSGSLTTIYFQKESLNPLGKNISPISYYPEEKEVLFPPGTQFVYKDAQTIIKKYDNKEIVLNAVPVSTITDLPQSHYTQQSITIHEICIVQKMLLKFRKQNTHGVIKRLFDTVNNDNKLKIIDDRITKIESFLNNKDITIADLEEIRSDLAKGIIENRELVEKSRFPSSEGKTAKTLYDAMTRLDKLIFDKTISQKMLTTANYVHQQYPNCELSHALRVSHYIPFVIEYFKEFAKEENFRHFCNHIKENQIETIQTAMLFTAVDQKNNINASALEKFVAENRQENASAEETTYWNELASFSPIFKQLGSLKHSHTFTEQSDEQYIFYIITLAQKLDAMRNVDAPHYLQSINEIFRLVKSNVDQSKALHQLFKLANDSLSQTGEKLNCRYKEHRIQSCHTDYNKDKFEKYNKQPYQCLESLSHIAKNFRKSKSSVAAIQIDNLAKRNS